MVRRRSGPIESLLRQTVLMSSISEPEVPLEVAGPDNAV